MQLGITFDCAWGPASPKSSQMVVRAPYYAHAFVADFIGTATHFRIRELDVGHDLLSAYAGYVGGRLKRVAIINFDVWKPSDGKRPSRFVNLLVAPGVIAVNIRKLTAAGGATAEGNFTWAGETWTGENNGKSQLVGSESSTVEVVNGTAQLKIEASQAVMVTIL